MIESIETRADRLKCEMAEFNAQIREDQRNLRSPPAAVAETKEDQIFRIHNRKPAPPVHNVDLNALPVTAIRMNDRLIEDFGDRERTYGPAFVSSGGKEFNLKNHNDQHTFMEMHWPDYPRGQWPAIYNSLHLQGRVTSDRAEVFARKLRAGHVVIPTKDLPHKCVVWT